MQTTLDIAGLSSRDRAGFTLFGSALLHIVVIMGVGFTFTLGQSSNRVAPTIATTLVSAQPDEDVEDAEVFADISQSGGGLADTPEPVRSPLPLRNDPATRIERTVPEHSESARRKVEFEFVYVALPDAVLYAANPDTADDAPSAETEHRQGAEAMLRSPLMARFDNEFSTGLEVPKQKFISSRTREHKYASYMEAWRAQVEQVGNTSYPEEARRRRLSGSLVLDVAIRADGSVHGIQVVRSSGQKILDDSAIRIVMMAAPFKPFPEEIRKDVDLLHITRTWQFLHNSALIRN